MKIGEQCFLSSFRSSFPHDRIDDKKTHRKVFPFITLGVWLRCLLVVPRFHIFGGWTNPLRAWKTLCGENCGEDSNVMSADFIEPTLGQLVLGFVFASRLHSPRKTFPEFNGSIWDLFLVPSIAKNCLTHRSPHKWITTLLLYLLPLGTYTRRTFFLRSSEWRKKWRYHLLRKENEK